MTQVDQFESVFRSADKAVYEYADIRIERVLLVLDLEGDERLALEAVLRPYLAGIDGDLEWETVGPDDFHTVSELLKLVEARQPDLVLTYRNLKSPAWRWPYSLGEYVDVLTQLAPCPVLLVPHPSDGNVLKDCMQNTDVVMAVTDHLAGDSSLVNYAVRLTERGGRLILGHVEDRASFERLLAVVGKIPSIETENARTEIGEQLLKEPRDYVESCRQNLAEAGIDLSVDCAVEMGDRLTEYERLARENKADLLVLHTKVDGQLAMGGNAYSLAVELREIPLLML